MAMAGSEGLISCRVAILGLGLMGGSLAMALRGKCAELLGIDPDPAALELALRWKTVDRVSAKPGMLLREADLIVLAAPVGAILSMLAELPGLHPGEAMVIDLGSTKVEIVEKMAGLPERFDPLGGHPMCGKERGGLINADPLIFNNAPFALTALPRSTRRVKETAEQLSRAVGALPIWLDPQTHDRWVASTSHLPYLVANSLAAVVPQEARPLVGPGLRSTTRLAPSPRSMMEDVLATNRLNVLAGLKRFRGRIEELEQMLEAGEPSDLDKFLAEGALNYERLVG